MGHFQHAIHLNPYGVAALGKGEIDYAKLIEAGTKVATTVGLSAIEKRSQRKQQQSDLAYQKKKAAIDAKTAASHSKLVDAQARLARASQPTPQGTPSWVWAVAGVGGLAVIGVIALALRK